MNYKKYEGHSDGSDWSVTGRNNQNIKIGNTTYQRKSLPGGACCQTMEANRVREAKDALLAADAPKLLEACKRKDTLLEASLRALTEACPHVCTNTKSCVDRCYIYQVKKSIREDLGLDDDSDVRVIVAGSSAKGVLI